MNPSSARISETSPRGFTLVETLVAIAILMVALTGPFYAVQQATTASYAARDQLIASSLAQEGAEYMYFLRDTRYLSGSPPLSGAVLTCFTQYGCTVDPSQSLISGCTSAGCSPLMMSSTNLYTQSGSYPVTRFTRTVKMEAVSAAQTKVTVTVTWVTSQRSYSVSVVENLYTWL